MLDEIPRAAVAWVATVVFPVDSMLIEAALGATVLLGGRIFRHDEAVQDKFENGTDRLPHLYRRVCSSESHYIDIGGPFLYRQC